LTKRARLFGGGGGGDGGGGAGGEASAFPQTLFWREELDLVQGALRTSQAKGN